MAMSGIPVASEIEAHRQTGVHILNQPPILGTFGKFTGNGTQNRAIPHSLGYAPKNGVRLYEFAAGSTGTMMQTVSGTWDDLVSGTYTVTGWDATNFYVGSVTNFYSNISTRSYQWEAI